MKEIEKCWESLKNGKNRKMWKSSYIVKSKNYEKFNKILRKGKTMRDFEKMVIYLKSG